MQTFRIDIPQAQLDDLHTRLDLTRWPDELPGADWDYGIPLGYVRELAAHWRHSYDWRAHEQLLNSFPQFTTEIDGQRIHFLHVRSPKPDALPLLMTHGWPGSVVEFLKVLEPLARDFHLVVPSLPGFGFSGPTRQRGWDLHRIAKAFAELMSRLGYTRYGAHGGDMGSAVSRELGLIDAEHIPAVHLTMLGTAPPQGIGPLTAEERELLKSAERFQAEGNGYLIQQATRPQTLAYGLHDSPVGQLAWITEKFKEWTDSGDTPEDAVDRDQMLTNVMVYWLTGTAGSSARLYRELTLGRAAPPQLTTPHTRVSTTPTGVALFPRDVARSVRRFAEATDNVVRWKEFDRGGHFPAMEEPELLVAEIREFFG